MYLLVSLLSTILLALQVIIFVQVILSWLTAFNVVSRHSPIVGGVVQGLDRITEPLYRPIRRVLPDLGAIDLAPLVVLIAISLLRGSVLPLLLSGMATDVI
ncbi:MAG: YggT family protein [Sphingomonas bacterium]|uniref:YggT family protein n=1 Tax=Sphingomonas bacterium TaxID=1895847 RepID=UPI002604AD76|nr:YggT family protein [Sphingomonas bacterium]MDB5695388.1 YggT family protein [Sphingomonas bacterium]